jgi:hypothetical protein
MVKPRVVAGLDEQRVAVDRRRDGLREVGELPADRRHDDDSRERGRRGGDRQPQEEGSAKRTKGGLRGASGRVHRNLAERWRDREVAANLSAGARCG